jgi:hypothetical protein
MNNQNIKCLINELRILRIRKIEVLDSIDQALMVDPSPSNKEGSPTVPRTHPIPPYLEHSVFDVGDRIEITNKGEAAI